MNYRLERERTPEARRDQIIDFVVTKMKRSEADQVGIRLRLPRLYDLWRGVYTGRFHPHKNNVHLPLIFSAIWSDAARKAATSMNTFPIVRFTGYGPDDAKIARKREALISAQFSDINIFMKMVDHFVTADLYGVAITQVGWTRKEELRAISNTVRLPLSGKIIKTVRRGKVIMFDGPDIENIDRLDFFPQEKVKTIAKMRGYVRRYIRDIDDVRALAESGMFNKAELRRMEEEGGVNATIAADEALIRRFQPYTSTSSDQMETLDKFSRPVELLEYWGYVPSELSDDGVLCRVITIANRRYVMRNEPNPYDHGDLPAIEFAPMPDPHYFDAPGKAEVAEKLQLTANRYVNQGLDAAEFRIDPMWFYDKGSGLNTNKLYSKPGRFIGVNGNPKDVIANLQGDTSGIAVAQGQVQMASQFAQMAMGIYDDVNQGGGGDSRQTAREFLGRREAAGTRLNLESMIFERNYLEPLANMFVALDKQFLETPTEVLILGDNSKFDPVTGDPIEATREVLDGFDLTPNYAARAYGALSALSKGTMQGNLMQLAQAVSANPQVAGAINMLNFWRGIFKEFEIPNVNEIFQKADFQTMINQANGGAPGGLGAVPTSKQLVGGAIPPAMAANIPGLAGGGAGEQDMPPQMMAAPQQG
jgi:hypothetical protein